MEPEEREEHLLRSVALRNARSILQARQRAEEDLVRTKEALERKTGELARSLAMLRATLESTTDAILVTDVDGRITDFNEKYTALWRLPGDVLEARDHRQVVAAIAGSVADPRAFRARVEEIYAEEPPETLDLLELADGRSIERHSRIQFLDQRVVGRVWSFRDVTERRRDEEARGRLAAIVESSDDAIVSKTLEGIIVTWNEGARRIFGYAAEEVVGKPVTILLPPDRLDEEKGIMERIFRGERVEQYETVRRRKDGTLFDVAITISPVKDSSGRTIGASKIARDITQRKRTEEALRGLAQEREGLLEVERTARREAERVSIVKDEFLANVSHELRTPLNAILGWSHLIISGQLGGTDLRQGLETIARNARTQAQLIEDLLDMSRIISGKLRLDLQLTDLARVVHGALDSVRPSAEARGVRLRPNVEAEAGPVTGDPTRLQQVVWNLLTNAVKFTPRGGTVDVLLKRVSSHLEITVQDSGQGIPADFLPYIFERFRQGDASSTRRQGGLGLGLSIVKHLVELHGGSVEARSPGEGQGATFVVRLPLAPVREDELGGAATGHPPGYEDVDLAGVQVLVVDDEADAREILRRMLARCHADVITAPGAAEGLRLVRLRKPDVLVSDIGMPEMDGHAFIREVRRLPAEEGGRTPAVALTAFARSEDRTRAILAGYQIHVAKPIEPQELVATVASLAGRMAGGGGVREKEPGPPA